MDSRILLTFGLILSGCGQPPGGDFASSPLCAPCVERACKADDGSFKSHVDTLNDVDQAQIIAQMESHAGCMETHAWAKALADKAYQQFGAAFYDKMQPWYEIRGKRAFDEIAQNTPNAGYALGYLNHHIEEWKQAAWAKTMLTGLESQSERDEVFGLLAQSGDSELLGRLCEMEASPARNAALITRWPELPEDVRARAIGAYVKAKWSLQTSGSAQLPQYLALNWVKRPLPDHVPDFAATLRVDSIRIKNEEVKRGQWRAADAFKWGALTKPDARHARVNLQPWLTSADTYRISVKAQMQVWAADAPKECLEQAESCESQPLASYDIGMDKSYRVFVGVVTGAPHRHKVDADNAKIAKNIHIRICNDEMCIPMWEGKAIKNRNEPLLKVSQGHDFYVLADISEASLPVSSRLMARPGEGREWREIAAFYGHAPSNYPVLARAEIDLGDLCGQIGPCELQFELRPSLRMARRDPRIERYWGSTLDLGRFKFDIQNLTANQMWGAPSPAKENHGP